MEPMTIRELLAATKGELLREYENLQDTISAVETDSRSIHPGSLFIPLTGDRFDGHSFISAALKDGAAGCLTVREPEEYLPGKFYIRVADTQKALGDLARFYRHKFSIPCIGITGSVGKTTTKDMVATVLGERFNVLKTEGNFNNEVGLPLTLFRLDSSIEVCVLEMGMNHFGEIDYLSSIAEPDVAVITNIGDAHIENLGSRANILKAKCEIFSHMKDNSLAVLNGDDPLLRTLADKIPQRIIFSGSDDHADYMGVNVVSNGEKGISFTMKTPRSTIQVDVPALGSHMIYPVLTAAVIGEFFGMTAEEIAAGVKKFVPTKMRMNVIRQGSITILDDSYNANPQSMRAALEVLAQSKSSYKAAILGDMFELGELGPTLHQSVGEYAGKAGIDCLIAVGELSKYIYEAAAASQIPDAYYCETKEEAKTILPLAIRPGATILVKASRGMEFEELVRQIRKCCPET